MRIEIDPGKTVDLPIADKDEPRQKQNLDGSWPMEELPTVQRMVVCTTSGCPFEGVGFTLTVCVNVDGTLRVICHQCQQFVTDLRRDLTPVGAEKLAALRDPRLLRKKQEEFAQRNKEALGGQRV